jgi:hypothetical protein
LVIFIDDLDRCAPRQTVDVLEAVNFVTSAGRCFVILGLDEDRVKAAIADIYKDMTLRLDDVEPSKTPEPPSAADDAAGRRDELKRFASRYLEKLVHLVVPVPRSREETVEMLLGLKPAPRPSPEERRRQKIWRSLINFAGTLAVVSFLAAAGALAIGLASSWLLPSLTVGEPAKIAAAQSPQGTPSVQPQQGQAPAGQQALPTADFVSNLVLEKLGVLSGNALEAIPPSALVLAFVTLLALAAFGLLKRLDPEPLVTDSPEFIDALRIWVRGISVRRQTPRAVKRFVNRLRFMAMRVREIDGGPGALATPLDEPSLVTFATIEDLDAGSLGETAETVLPPGGAGTDEGRLIYQGLIRFRDEFGRDAYSNPNALDIYRIISGLVEERGGIESTST